MVAMFSSRVVDVVYLGSWTDYMICQVEKRGIVVGEV